MTTIACDGITLAVDSRIHQGPIYSDKHVKLFEVEEGAIAISGQSEDAQLFVQWWKGGKLPDKWPFGKNCEFEALVLYQNGRLERWNESHCTGLPLPTPYAVGSGAQAAMAAMLLMCDPVKAVATAAKVDSNTGGQVRSFSRNCILDKPKDKAQLPRIEALSIEEDRMPDYLEAFDSLRREYADIFADEDPAEILKKIRES